MWGIYKAGGRFSLLLTLVFTNDVPFRNHNTNLQALDSQTIPDSYKSLSTFQKKKSFVKVLWWYCVFVSICLSVYTPARHEISRVKAMSLDKCQRLFHYLENRLNELNLSYLYLIHPKVYFFKKKKRKTKKERKQHQKLDM